MLIDRKEGFKMCYDARSVIICRCLWYIVVSLTKINEFSRIYPKENWKKMYVTCVYVTRGSETVNKVNK